MSDLEKTPKNEFFDAILAMRPDVVYPSAWSEDKKAQAAELVRPNTVRKNMFAGIPMVCKSTCPYLEICPLVAQNSQPVGERCPIETSAVVEMMTSYIEELGVHPSNMTEISMIRDLVNQEIQQQRATWRLSQEDFIQENPVGVDGDGSIIMRKELHLAVDLEDRISKRKEKLRSQLLSTRQAKAQVGLGNVDAIQNISNALEEMRKIERDKAKAILDAKGITDEYIEDAEIINTDNEDSLGSF